MSTAIDQVLDLIGNMTVLELSELKKKYEDKFGVTAAAPMMAMPMGGIDSDLEEIAEALELDLEQVRNLEIPFAVDLGKALPVLTAYGLQGLPAFLRGEVECRRRAIPRGDALP